MTDNVKNPHEMTYNELCLAISEKREPKPDSLLTEAVWTEKRGSWQIHAGRCEWTPINWLSWENAGRLLEEMADKIDSIEIDNRAFEYDSWRCFVIHGVNFSVECEKLPRAICEAWLCQ